MSQYNTPERCIVKFLNALKKFEETPDKFGNADFQRGIKTVKTLAEIWFEEFVNKEAKS